MIRGIVVGYVIGATVAGGVVEKLLQAPVKTEGRKLHTVRVDPEAAICTPGPVFGPVSMGEHYATPPPREVVVGTFYCLTTWYGGGERLNSHTANGERFNPRALTCAHRSIPFGTELRVTNTRNGMSVVVRVNDRGPARRTGKSLDLTRTAMHRIGGLSRGVIRVKVEVLK